MCDCQNKPVKLNHLNTGTRHLADKPPEPKDWIPPSAIPSLAKRKIVSKKLR
jgi:hypothetical protein